jgi:hypothetical protein
MKACTESWGIIVCFIYGVQPPLFDTQDKIPSTHRVEKWVDPRYILNMVGKKPLPARDQSLLILCVIFIVHYPSFLK